VHLEDATDDSTSAEHVIVPRRSTRRKGEKPTRLRMTWVMRGGLPSDRQATGLRENSTTVGLRERPI